MFIPLYDEFLIYTSVDDVELYLEKLIQENPALDKEEAYEKCLNYFGESSKYLISGFFN